MIVFDLRCGRNHVFEGWFASSADYDAQCASGMIACPMCDDIAISKSVMAPNISAKGDRPAQPSGAEKAAVASIPVTNTGPVAAQFQQLIAAIAEKQADALKSSTWVGRDFAETVRSMHYGEEAHSNVHGEAAPDEARALVEEGIAIAPILFPVVPPEQQN